MKNYDEYMKLIAEKMVKMDAYDDRLKIANHKNIDEIDNLVILVNQVLAKHGIMEAINKNHIRFNADYIGNITRIDDKKLSQIILEHIYPTPKKKIFSHYTRFDNGVSIIDKGEFWLFNLLQNFVAEEFRLFYREHGLDGYEENRETFGIWTGYRPLMSEIFALCLTTEENKSPTLWNSFADNGTGMKLTFEIVSKIPDFREVYYSNMQNPQPIPLLKDLFYQIKDKFKYPFNFTYMSKIGAFYIKGNFENEKEFRFLIKRDSDSYNAWQLNPITFLNDISYIILPFDSEYAKFKLLKVKKGPHCCLTKFEKIIPMIKHKYSDVEIIR
ncbi:MAG: hypothetical protein WC209_05790 [Ignavibacteriaceae bacterium]|jgi:hypothetical protein